MSAKKESQQVTFESIGVHADVCTALNEHNMSHPLEFQRKILLHTVNDFADVIAESTAHSGRHSLIAIFAVHCVRSSDPKSNVVIVANNTSTVAKITKTIQTLLGSTRVCAMACLDEPPKMSTTTPPTAGAVFVATLPSLSKWPAESFVNTVTFIAEDCCIHDTKPLQTIVEMVIERSPQANLFFLSSRPPSEVSMSIRYLLRRKNRRYYFQANTSAKFSYLMCHDAADREALCMQVAQLKGLKSVLILTHNKEVRDLKANVLRDLGVKTFCIQRNTPQPDHDRSLGDFLRSPYAILVAMDAYPGVDVMDLDAIIQYYPPQKSMPEEEWAEYVSYLQTTCDPRRTTTVVTLVAPDDFSLVQYFMKRVGAEGPVINIGPTHPLLPAAVFHPELILQEKTRIENSGRGASSSKTRSPVAASAVPLPRSQRADGGKGSSSGSAAAVPSAQQSSGGKATAAPPADANNGKGKVTQGSAPSSAATPASNASKNGGGNNGGKNGGGNQQQQQQQQQQQGNNASKDSGNNGNNNGGQQKAAEEGREGGEGGNKEGGREGGGRRRRR
eukprot:CAMPEP_0176410804 /NCGR_PEP_ID=MMETSP0127-20121128/3259_1 /TAXON_ID=938130 /ORGANISM="Platyophrya macrostoma, Strain WH" /LENGTH=558 /DNA_ID=CAMNT_0017790339 /DNA_START=106 /DNA_END=1782 /DNA_ORIENTATION=-